MCVKFRSTGVSAKHDGPFACRQMSLTLHVIRVSWCLPLVRGFYLLLFWNRWTSAHYAFWNWSPRYLARTFESRREKAHPRSLIRARCSQEAFVFRRLSKEQTSVFFINMDKMNRLINMFTKRRTSVGFSRDADQLYIGRIVPSCDKEFWLAWSIGNLHDLLSIVYQCVSDRPFSFYFFLSDNW